MLSLTAPGVEQLDPAEATSLARESNDELADFIKAHPDRFVGFAALSPQRAGSCGQGTGESSQGTRFDRVEKPIPILATAIWTMNNTGRCWKPPARWEYPYTCTQRLRPSASCESTAFPLAGAPFGFGVETAMCLMRLILSGAMDKFSRTENRIGNTWVKLCPLFCSVLISPGTARIFDPEARPNIAGRPSDYVKKPGFCYHQRHAFPAGAPVHHGGIGRGPYTAGLRLPVRKHGGGHFLPGECSHL